ncbi:hypothetical protein [Deinococcus rubellus]|uniref:hypothetical protein n=1 Tax=Deinococcus rubellus TaxID=1889240 RepID=UPI0031EFD688
MPARRRRMGMVGGGKGAITGAFANIYLGAVQHIRTHAAQPHTPTSPTMQGGLHGMNFIQSVVGSSRSAERWTTLGAE